MLKLVYICGPISGDQDSIPEVNHAAAVRKARDASRVEGILLNHGYFVYNPFGSALCFDNHKIAHELWMNQAEFMLRSMAREAYRERKAGRGGETLLVQLRGWEDSSGARRETRMCIDLEFDITSEEDVLSWED